MGSQAVMTLSSDEKEVLRQALDEGFEGDSGGKSEEKSEDVKEPEEAVTEENEGDKQEEAPVKYEIESVFPDSSPMVRLQDAINRGRQDLSELKKMLDDGKLSEEEYEARAGKVTAVLARADAQLDAVRLYHGENFKTAVNKYCREHSAVRQSKPVYNAFAGMANEIYSEMEASGKTVSPEEVLDRARLAVERDFQCDLSGDRIKFVREGAKSSDKKPPKKAARDALKSESIVPTPPDLGRVPKAGGSNVAGVTKFDVLDELAGKNTAEFVREFEKLSSKEMDAYLAYSSPTG